MTNLTAFSAIEPMRDERASSARLNRVAVIGQGHARGAVADASQHPPPWRSLFAVPGMSEKHVAARYGGIAYIASATRRGEPGAETTRPTST